VVGINAAMVSAGQGIGFAIPINTVMAVEQELARNGSIRRGWMGVGIQTLTPELAESFGAKGDKGILVSRVVPRSPADKGGLRGGDIITSFRGKPVSGVKEFQKQVTAAAPGGAVAMDILRGGKRARVEVIIAELEGQETPAQSRKAPVDDWGLAVEGLPARALRDLGIDGGVEVVRPRLGTPRGGRSRINQSRWRPRDLKLAGLSKGCSSSFLGPNVRRLPCPEIQDTARREKIGG
jgi:serine protease Do